MKIGILEDDENVRLQLQELLQKQGYSVMIFKEEDPITDYAELQVLLLDIHLPNHDGYQLCKKMKQQYHFPIIFVTSDTQEEAEYKSIISGGDDFITKPYHKGVLLEKIKRAIERENPQNHKELCHRGVVLDLHVSKIKYQNKENELTRNEFLILYYFFLHPGQIISKQELMEYLWNDKFYLDENVLLVNINRLRKKLEEIGVVDFIQTIRNAGYQI